MPKVFKDLINLVSTYPWQTALVLLGLYVAWKLSWLLVRYLFERRNVKNLVYMKVSLPRNESQKDWEKQTEKDFREKIAIMEQLYRSLHEIRELNLWNVIKVKLFHLDVVSFEILAESKKVQFFVSTYKDYADLLEKQITTFYSDADIQLVEPYDVRGKNKYLRCYYMFAKKPFWYPIMTYKNVQNDPLNDLTNVLSKLEEDEKVLIQVNIRTIGDSWRKKAEDVGGALFKGKKGVGWFSGIPGLSFLNTIFISLLFGYEDVQGKSSADKGDPILRMLASKEEVAKRIGEKASQVGFETTIRVMAAAKTKQRVVTMLNNVVLGFNVFKDASANWFQNRRIVPIDFINNSIFLNNFKNRYFKYGEKSSIFVPEELASLFHYPNSRYNFTPIIDWLDYKVLPPPREISSDGILLGHNLYRGVKKEILFGKKDRMRHHYVIGQTGTGKSSFLGYIARQDIKNGEGICVIDPHGDLIEEILAYVQKERARDVIVFDPSDQERPMGLNILEANTPEQQDMASSQATEIFIKLFGDEIFGPRIQHYFRNACLTLMEDKDEGATLIDVPRIFTDDEFMKYKVSKLKNPVVRSFWEHEYASTGQRERQEMIPYFSSKFGPFITNTVMRNTIGQTKSAFDFREVMDNGKILLVNLAKGKIGALNTQLLGLILVARFQMAAMSRADMPQDQRRDFYLYVDEFQNFATDSFSVILSEARKYRLALVMAHQYINQLVVTKFGTQSTQIRDAVFGNVGTIMSFKVGADDAEYLAREYAPVLSEQDVIGIPNYQAYLKLNINNATSRPFSLKTIWDPAGQNAKVAKIVKEYSRMKYGRKRIFVDQEITSRIGIDMG